MQNTDKTKMAHIYNNWCQLQYMWYSTYDTTTTVDSESYIYKYIIMNNIHEYISSYTNTLTTTDDNDYSKRYEKTS